MKKKLLLGALVLSLPMSVLAGVSIVLAEVDSMYVVNNSDRERQLYRPYQNYRLIWNPEIKMFELQDGDEHTPLNLDIDEPLNIPQQDPTPHRYGDELSI